MKQPRDMLVRSVSAVSQVGNKVLLSLISPPGRKGNRISSDQTTEEIADPAYLLAEALGGQNSSSDASPMTPEAGCRQGGYFDSLEFDLGIPKVTGHEVEVTEEDASDTVYDFVDSPNTTSDEVSNDAPVDNGGNTALRRLRMWKAKMRKISESLLSRDVPEAPQSSSSSESSLASLDLPELRLPPQLARMSYASDATTGTLLQYLARRLANQKATERLSSRSGGISILGYEREGSWLVNDEVGEDTKFTCPFPQCEAHHGCSRNSVISRSWHRERLRLPVETVFED